jgi:type IV pilus assembly protein PilO
MVWIRSRGAAIARQFTHSFRSRQRPKLSNPWWKKDLRGLLADLGQRGVRLSSETTLRSVTDISQWTLRFRIKFLVIVFVVGVLTFSFLLSSDRLNNLSAQNVEREVLKSRYLRYAEQVNMLTVYQTQTETILERFGDLLDAIPAALESIHVLSQLNKAARDSGLQLEFFKPLAEQVHNYYVVLPVEIRLRGDYNATARFIELVSKMQHLVTVDLVILASANHPNQVVLSSLLKAYRYKDLPKKSESRFSRGIP